MVAIKFCLFAAIVGCGLLIIRTDCQTWRIPNNLLIIFALLSLFFKMVDGTPPIPVVPVVISCYFIGQVLYLLVPGGLGYGDVKLLTICGVFIPLPRLGWFLMAVGVWGLMTALVYYFYGRQRYFPLAPALILGVFTALACE